MISRNKRTITLNFGKPEGQDILRRLVEQADVVIENFRPGVIGQPTLVANHLDDSSGVILHTENGMPGMGPAALGDDIDPDLTNSGKAPVTELPGAAYFHQADSFAMMRGGHRR